MKFKSLLSGACACLFVQSPVFSQETNSNKEETEAEQCWSGVGASLEGGQCLKEVDLLGQLELETPENALFTLMGATPDTMLRPKVGDKLAISFLPDIANALGSEQYSIGVNVNPGLWIMPDYYSPVDFKATSSDWKGGSDRVEQFKNAAYWSRFNISFASAQTTGDGALKKHGLGVSYKYDAGSPLEVLRSGGYGDCILKKLPILRDKETLRAQDIAEKLLDEVISKSTPGSIFEHRSFNTANPELEIDYFVRNNDVPLER